MAWEAFFVSCKTKSGDERVVLVSTLFAMGTLTFVSAWRWDCLQSFDLTRWRELLFRLRFKVQNQAESVLCTRVFTKTHSTFEGMV